MERSDNQGKGKVRFIQVLESKSCSDCTRSSRCYERCLGAIPDIHVASKRPIGAYSFKACEPSDGRTDVNYHFQDSAKAGSSVTCASRIFWCDRTIRDNRLAGTTWRRTESSRSGKTDNVGSRCCGCRSDQGQPLLVGVPFAVCRRSWDALRMGFSPACVSTPMRSGVAGGKWGQQSGTTADSMRRKPTISANSS